MRYFGVSCHFVTHVLTSCPGLGYKVPRGRLLAERPWIHSFSSDKKNFWFSLHHSIISTYSGCSSWPWTNLFWSHFLSHRAAYLCYWWSVRVEGPLLPPHITDAALKSFPVQWVPALYRGVNSGRGVTLTPPPPRPSNPWSWKSRAIPLLPL